MPVYFANRLCTDAAHTKREAAAVEAVSVSDVYLFLSSVRLPLPSVESYVRPGEEWEVFRWVDHTSGDEENGYVHVALARIVVRVNGKFYVSSVTLSDEELCLDFENISEIIAMHFEAACASMRDLLDHV